MFRQGQMDLTEEVDKIHEALMVKTGYVDDRQKVQVANIFKNKERLIDLAKKTKLNDGADEETEEEETEEEDTTATE